MPKRCPKDAQKMPKTTDYLKAVFCNLQKVRADSEPCHTTDSYIDMQCHMIPCNTLPWNTLQYLAIPYNTMHYHKTLYNIACKTSRLPCYVFCICLFTNKYQKYKSVELGDQLTSPQSWAMTLWYSDIGDLCLKWIDFKCYKDSTLSNLSPKLSDDIVI